MQRSYEYYTDKLANPITKRQRTHNYGVLVNAIRDYFRNRTTLDTVSKLIELGHQLDFIAGCRGIPDLVPTVVERPLVRNPNRQPATQLRGFEDPNLVLLVRQSALDQYSQANNT